MSFVSYAQNGEDVFLNRVFGGQGTGFYVDVGAYHPVTGSVTKSFYDRGWSGINVEPGSVFLDLAAARPRDVNLRMAVLDRTGETAFIEDVVDRGTSRTVDDDGDAPGGRTLVPCDTLESIVAVHGHGRPVDFVKVDAEGAEAAIVRSTDWRRLRPRVLLLEATRPWSSLLANQEWEPVLLGHGYVRVYFDGINCFYIPEEEAPALLLHFQTPINVLDRAERYDDMMARAALTEQQAAAAAVTAERDILHATLRALREAEAAWAAERDTLQTALREQREAEATLRAALREQQDTVVHLATERATLGAALSERQDAVAQLAAERDALRARQEQQDIEARRLAVEQAAQQAAQHAEAVRQLQARLAVSVAETPPRSSGWRRRLARRAALAAYKPVRPLARPMVWRLRGFLVGGLFEQLRLLGEMIEAVPSRVTAAPAQVVTVAPPSVVQIRDDGAATEMRRLAAEMERTLLTLALERGPNTCPAAMQAWPTSSSPPPPVAATPDPRLTLLLPRGRTAAVGYAAGDLSVSAALLASGGEWELHVRSYLERIVQADWVCLDIGANLGAHTLSLAVLAATGRVVAFEADAANFRLLAANAAALAAPCATIEPVHLALWDRPGTLIWSGADEVAGCTFVAEDPGDAAAIEQRLRAVISRDALDGVDLHIRRGEVSARSLDAWADETGLMRLDLIKLDVEGAESRVIRGADATIRRLRPVLLVEYNPTCAATYFGQPADALYQELASRFASIAAVEPDGTTSTLADWPALEARLTAGKGWEDLVCWPDRPDRA